MRKEIALSILQDIFGYKQFRGNQAEIVDHVMAGEDALVLMPTGGGKSLCFQIPAIANPGTGIVISPLIALMQDQVDALLQLGVSAAFLNSSQDIHESRAIEKKFLNQSLDLLYVAPERLLTPRFLQILTEVKVNLFAIDEAHCVSQWGHDFRPEYVKLSALHERFPNVPRIALTATADEVTRKEILQQLKLEDARQFTASFNRENIRYRIVQKNNPREQLLQFIKNEHSDNAGIVYCLSRKKVEETALWLQLKGYSAAPYHAGLTTQVRMQTQQKFIREEGQIIVATVAFGMGIDKPNVRFVAHLDLPRSLEAYYQETGRAGRDSLPADAWMSYGISDVVSIRQMVENSDASEQHKKQEKRKLEALLGFCETIACRRHVLLNYFGEDSPLHCQNCDNCLEPVARWDGKVAAQKALSCVYRTGQLFGVKHIVDVLLGKATEQVQRFGHQTLSTFGIGMEHSQNEWQSLFRQLVAGNILKVDVAGFGSLKFTEKTLGVLRGESDIAFRKEREQSKKKSKTSHHQDTNPQDELWHALKNKRTELAHAQNVPPYVIFHDSSLLEIHSRRPITLDEFATISGVGHTKLARYAQTFIKVVEEFA